MIITDLTMLGKSTIPNINPKNNFRRLSKVLLLIRFFIRPSGIDLIRILKSENLLLVKIIVIQKSL